MLLELLFWGLMALSGATAVVIVRKALPLPEDEPRKPLTPGSADFVCTIQDLKVPVAFEYFEVNGAKWGDSSPTVVLFHGLGATPKAIRRLFQPQNPVKILVPRGIIKYGRNRGWWKARSVGDQELLAQQMAEVAALIDPLLVEINRCNTGPLIVAGHSQGGMLALALARLSRQVSGAVSGSAWLPAGLQGPMARTILVHGTEDPTIPYQRTRAWATAAPNVAFRPVPGGTHAIKGALLAKWRQGLDEMTRP